MSQNAKRGIVDAKTALTSGTAFNCGYLPKTACVLVQIATNVAGQTLTLKVEGSTDGTNFYDDYLTFVIDGDTELELVSVPIGNEYPFHSDYIKVTGTASSGTFVYTMYLSA